MTHTAPSSSPSSPLLARAAAQGGNGNAASTGGAAGTARRDYCSFPRTDSDPTLRKSQSLKDALAAWWSYLMPSYASQADSCDSDVDCSTQDNVTPLTSILCSDVTSSPSSKSNTFQEEDVCEDSYETLRLLAVCAVCVLSGVANNVTFVKMGDAMLDYPLFLLYGTTALYGVVYLVWLRLRTVRSAEAAAPPPAVPRPSDADLYHPEATAQPGAPVDIEMQQPVRSPSASARALYVGSAFALWKNYAGIAILVSVSGTLAQFADTHVSGSYQALMNQMMLPLTVVFARLLLNHRHSTIQHVGAGVVLLGSSLPLVLPYITGQPADDDGGSGSGFWLLLFAASQVPAAIVSVWEQHIFSDAHAADEIHYLASTNLITLVGYVCVIPIATFPRFGGLSVAELWTNQVDAFHCFVGAEPLPHGCQPRAYLPVLGFVCCVVLYYYTLTVLCKKESATFQVLVNALVTPVSAVAFSSTVIMGADAQPLSTTTMIACGVIPFGILLYKWSDLLPSKVMTTAIGCDPRSYPSAEETDAAASPSPSPPSPAPGETTPLIVRH